ncbi:MAG: hypothetical protein BGO30_07030 [Bacteroidetes bacterium 41-46]|nr:MAG: hypothetical protein BGO30_07030 [Bacteroidetes bacterium 41-46]
MNKFLKISLGLALLMLFASCKKDPPPVLNLSVSSIEVHNNQGSGTVNISANAQWSSSSTVSWLTISPSSGSGDATVTITAQDNLSRSNRSGSVIFTIGQEGKTNYLKKILSVNQSLSQLTLDLTQLSFEKSAGSKTVKITSNTKWNVTIPSQSSWLTANSLTGNNNADLILTASENTGGDRSSKVLVAYGDTVRTIEVLQKRALNNNPTQPQLSYPSNSATGVSRLVQCQWSASTDADQDKVKYSLEISDNSAFSGADGKFLKTYDAGQINSFSIPELLKENTKFYWRVTASDDFQGKSTSSVFSFTTGAAGGYMDGEYRVAFSNSAGTYPNEIIFIGDGYIIPDFVDGGKFDQDMDEGIEAFFAVEPYKTYRNHFKVYKLAAYSKESGATQTDRGIVKETAFSTVFKGGSSMETDDVKIFELVSQKIPGMQDDNPYYSGIQGKVQNTLIVLVVNEDRYAGTCWMWSDGRAIAICPTSRDTRGTYHYRNVVNHEAGGHGFGRLADEYITSANKDKTITDTEKSSFQQWVKYGFYPNVDLTSDLNAIKWKHFVGKEGYAVGAHEGAYYFTFGAWRPEPSSCMIDNRQYYNAPSRENIVKRILRTAAGVRASDYLNGVLTPIQNDPYNFNDFVSRDVKKTEAATLFYTKSYNPLTFQQLAPPVLIEVK